MESTNMAAKQKHKARKVDPRIVALADEVGMRLFRRDGELWLNGDLQLTYKFIDQKSQRREATDDDRVEMACDILRSVLEARRNWGTVAERFRAIWKGMGETVPSYRSNTYTYYRDPSLDCGWMIRCQLSPRWEMGIDLCGEDRVRVSGESTDECLAKLAEHSRTFRDTA